MQTNKTSASSPISLLSASSPFCGLPRVPGGLGSIPALASLGINTSSLASAAFGASLPDLCASNGYSKHSIPPSPPGAKRPRPTLDDFPRILPKNPLSSSPSSLNLSGLLTPISLGAAAVNSIASTPQGWSCF